MTNDYLIKCLGRAYTPDSRATIIRHVLYNWEQQGCKLGELYSPVVLKDGSKSEKITRR